ncbi:MAG: NADH-quinone oxidoreductase subunit M [Acidimicrobiia bacterium]|nr:NADH-quinone oxidoreductase subunit M [Acidimicrobiia bacterium]MYC57708.1 NADH-quinone oxidoreductase subunit M [Acidimicrobiia bacterium]MYG93612.1 NADH-quinone oxidoreductase subunit M [Acidimicrobiia bacterium]MYI30907.1 NADH-quinone oxidoreductase subunit M [Acidimicrobiia bacterium]
MGAFTVLSLIIFLPLLGAVVIALTAPARSVVFKPVAVATSAVTGALILWLMADFDKNDGGFQYTQLVEWVSSAGISWHVGVDGISLFLVVLTGVLFPLAILACDPPHDAKAYYVWMLVLETGCLGAFLALDLVLFFLFFEIVLIPMYFLIGCWGHGNRKQVATKFFLFTLLGSALMFVGMLVLALLVVHETGEALTFNLLELANSVEELPIGTARWIFLSFALAFAVKVPLFPLHTWLPDAHTEAPTAGSVILAGVMLKLGTYGLVRFGLYLFPEASHYFAPLFFTLGVIGILYGAVVAAMQKDLKRLVAYSSVAHLGFIVLGIFAFNTEGISGGLLQMVNHGISTGALFLLVGFIYERRHTRQISELMGLQKAVPVLAAVFVVVMLSSVGLPGLNGFVGEFLILAGAFVAHRWWALLAAVGVILAALYLLWAYQRVFHGTPDEAATKMADLTWQEKLVMLPLVGLIVFMGVYPKPVLERMEPAVHLLIEHVEQVQGIESPTVNNRPHGSFVDLRELIKEHSYDHNGHDHDSHDHREGSDH